jgi:plastocyanin
VEDLEDSINDLDVSSTTDSSPLDLEYSGSDSTSETVVEIENESFVPVYADVEVGGVVKWVNNTDSSHRVTDIDRELFTSSIIEPGKEFTHEFEEESTVVYKTTTTDTPIYGAVLVGDVDKPALPTDTDTEPETFEVSNGGTRTLTQAAEEKEDMDLGF